MWAWLSGLFNSAGGGSLVKDTLSGVGGLAKDVKTLITGKMDPKDASEILLKVGELEDAILKSQSSIVQSEAGGSWLQRNWRPITMLVFLVLVIFNQFGLLVIPLSNEIWELFKIGLGGYIIGRSVEKLTGRT